MQCVSDNTNLKRSDEFETECIDLEKRWMGKDQVAML